MFCKNLQISKWYSLEKIDNFNFNFKNIIQYLRKSDVGNIFQKIKKVDKQILNIDIRIIIT